MLSFKKREIKFNETHTQIKRTIYNKVSYGEQVNFWNLFASRNKFYS